MTGNKQSKIIYGLLVFFVLFCLWLKIAVVGLLFWAAAFLFQADWLESLAKEKWKCQLEILKYFWMLSIYIFVLSLVYYFFGLNIFSLSISFLVISLPSLLFLRIAKSKVKAEKKDFFKKKIGVWPLFALLLLGLFFIYFGFRPVLDGNPTPWSGVPAFFFGLFFLVSLILSLGLFFKRDFSIGGWAYLIFIVSIVPLRYVLSFNYDTLIHQSALAYIAAHGQIAPLTPFYVGQYGLEILINAVSRLPFVFIERWFLPAVFVLICGGALAHLLRLTGKKIGFFAVPAAILLFLPNIFYYTSPYSFALTLAFATAVFICLFIVRQEKKYFWTALALAVAAILVHPFVGLAIFISAIFSWFFAGAKKFSGQAINLGVLFVFVSLAAVIAFLFYNWIGGQAIYLANPAQYFGDFASIFSNPTWYVFAGAPSWLVMIYAYEKAIVFIAFILAAAAVVFLKGRLKLAAIFIFILGLGSAVSAWLFASGIEVGGYSFNDQANYSFRLVQAAKWFWFIPGFLYLSSLPEIISKTKIRTKIIAAIFLSFLLTGALYLTCPRRDAISNLNVNNVRAADFQIINYIHNRENGKDGYLVYANQILGAAAILNYGFGPYYQSPWGNLFYYSTPMASETNQRFEMAMRADNFNYQGLAEVAAEIGVKRFYFIVTSYWPLNTEAEIQMEAVADEKVSLGGGDYVFFFTIK